MVYDWDAHEKTCYRMYIDERKSLEEIMEYLRVHHKFSPSKRAFQTQFRRWDFPSKQNPAHKNDRLVARVKELWEKNLSQREMLRILNEEEGFDIKQRELMRVRTRNRWLLRMPNPSQSERGSSANVEDDDTVMDSQLDIDLQLGQDQVPDQVARVSENDTSAEMVAKRRDRLQKLEAQSAERWETRKRRRRTRGWAGLPADPPGPPRFPSETTIEESKKILQLGNDTYRELRTRFARICEETDVSKKTIAGPERWESVKNQLIQESPHMQTVIWVDKTDIDSKKLALDVICTDVTKRMRTMEHKMTIAEAKNVLCINPEESRTIRQEFLAVLKGDQFTSKLESGQEHWDELKGKWAANSAILRGLLAKGAADPRYEEKIKAIEVLARDVMKRLRDDQTRRDPKRARRAMESSLTLNNNPPQPHSQHNASIISNMSSNTTGQQLQQDEDIMSNMSANTTEARLQQNEAVIRNMNAPNTTEAHLQHDEDVMGNMNPNTTDRQIQRDEASMNSINTMSHHDELQADDYSQMQDVTHIHHMAPHTPLVPSTPNAYNGHVNNCPPQIQSQEHLQPSPHNQNLQAHLSPNSALSGSPSHTQSQLMSNSPPHNQAQLLPLHSNLPIDPQIDASMPVLAVMSDPDSVATQHYSPFLQDLSQNQAHPAYVQQHFGPPQPTPLAPTAVWFRVDPSQTSDLRMTTRTWFATLHSRTFDELRRVAVKDLPGWVCGRVYGILTPEEGMQIAITRDDELNAFLAVKAGSEGGASFYVQLFATG